MNPELKAKWVAALRSGHYKQGFSQLRTPDDKFCCLGVLCDIIDPTAWSEDRWRDKESGNIGFVVLPAGLAQRIDLIQTVISPEGYNTSLAEMNDRGYTFDQIADIIEGQIR